MNGLLPLLLVQFFYFLFSRRREGTIYFGFGLALMSAMLIIVHAREFVQFVVYLGCFLMVAAVYPSFRRFFVRLAITFVVAAAAFISYNLYYAELVPAHSCADPSGTCRRAGACVKHEAVGLH